MTNNQAKILSVRRAIWIAFAPGIRERKDCAEVAFGAGFSAALDQVSPSLEGKIDADALMAKFESLGLTAEQKQGLAEILAG